MSDSHMFSGCSGAQGQLKELEGSCSFISSCTASQQASTWNNACMLRRLPRRGRKSKRRTWNALNSCAPGGVPQGESSGARSVQILSKFSTLQGGNAWVPFPSYFLSHYYYLYLFFIKSASRQGFRLCCGPPAPRAHATHDTMPCMCQPRWRGMQHRRTIGDRGHASTRACPRG